MSTDGFAQSPLCYLDVGVRPSRRGIERAARLSSVLEAPLRVVGIFSEKGASPSRAVRERLRAEYRDRLQELARAATMESDVEVLPAASGSDILAAIRRHEPRLIVTSDRSTAHQRFSFGPDPVRSVMRDAPAPVLVLPPSSTGPVRSIVAAVDLSSPQGRPESAQLAREVLRRSGELARAFGAELSIVHAWTLVGEGRLTHPLTPLRSSRLGSVRRTLRQERRRQLDALIQSVPQATPTRVLLGRGTATDVVRRTVRELEADILVLGHSGRTGLSRLLIGDLSEMLMGTVAASMLVVHTADHDQPLATPRGSAQLETSHGEG